jgi:hypothetical protein
MEDRERKESESEISGVDVIKPFSFSLMNHFSLDSANRVRYSTRVDSSLTYRYKANLMNSFVKHSSLFWHSETVFTPFTFVFFITFFFVSDAMTK